MTTDNLPPSQQTIKICSVEGCETKHHTKGYCKKHYSRFSRHGDPNISLTQRYAEGIICAVENCQTDRYRADFCPKHYARFYKYGDPTFARIKTPKQLKECSVDSCDADQKFKGLCSKHYQRMHKFGDASATKLNRGKGSTPEQRFWSRVALTADIERCWDWQGSLSNKGYAWVNWTANGRKNYLGSRFAYYLFYGIDPVGKLVCHKCDNPKCVNPHHLFLGTHQDNADDKMAKGRHHSQRDSQ